MLSSTAETLIGSRGCAIMLSDPNIAPQQARVSPSGGAFHIDDLGGGTQVNGTSITGSVALKPGDTITVGSTDLVFQGPAPKGVPKPPAVAPQPQPLAAPPPPQAQPAPKPQPAALAFPTYPADKAPQLQGQVVHIDGPHPEEPDPDPAGCLLRATFGVFLLPFIIWQPGLIVPFFLYGRRERQIPTRYLRVRDGSQEVLVKMKGETRAGMISQGDHASFWGRWDGGTLLLDRAENHRTNSEVVMKTYEARQRNQIIVGVIVGIIILLWLASALGG